MRNINIKNVIQGTVYSLFNVNQELNDVREVQCKQCPLLINDTCNRQLALHSQNEELISPTIINSNQLQNQVNCKYSSSTKGLYYSLEYTTGCGCGLDKKRRLLEETCPLNLWKDIDREYLKTQVNDNELLELMELGVVRFALKHNRKIDLK